MDWGGVQWGYWECTVVCESFFVCVCVMFDCNNCQWFSMTVIFSVLEYVIIVVYSATIVCTFLRPRHNLTRACARHGRFSMNTTTNLSLVSSTACVKTCVRLSCWPDLHV